MRRFFKTKMHQNAFGGRAPPGPAGGAHSAPPDLLAVFREGRPPPSGKEKGMGMGREGGKRGRGKGEGEKWEREGEEGKRGGGKGVCPSFSPVPPPSNSWRRL